MPMLRLAECKACAPTPASWPRQLGSGIRDHPAAARFCDRRHAPPRDLSPRSARRRRGLLRFGEDRVDVGLDQFEHERDLAGDGICPGSRAAVGLPGRACNPDCVVRCQRNKFRINLRGDGNRFWQHARSARGCMADQCLVRRPGDVCNDNGGRQIRTGLRFEHDDQRHRRHRQPGVFRRRPHRSRNDVDDLVARRSGRRAGHRALCHSVGRGRSAFLRSPPSGARSARSPQRPLRSASSLSARSSTRPVTAIPLGSWRSLAVMGGLRRDPSETATVVVILCCFAVWGTLAGSGPLRAGQPR